MKHIFVIDDDIHIGNMLEEILVKEGYHVSRAYSGTEALLFLSATRPDLVLLDLMLPGLNGEKILPQIQDIPVIIVSAKADADNKADLLFEGAADYITKPFHTKELLARIAVQLRRTAALPEVPLLTFGELTLHIDLHSASIGAEEIRLTPTEFAILKLLMQNPGRVITKSVLLDRIGEDTPDCTESSLKTHVSNMRRKLREAGGTDFIESVWGIGFRLRTE